MVGLEVLSESLDFLILRMFSSIDNPVILRFQDALSAAWLQVDRQSGMTTGSCLLLWARARGRLMLAPKESCGCIPSCFSVEWVQPPVVQSFLRDWDLKGCRQCLAGCKLEVLVN